MEQEYYLRVLCDLTVDKFPFDNHECKFRQLNEEKRSLELVLHNTRDNNGPTKTYKDGFEITITWHGGIVGKNSTHVKFDLELNRILTPFIFQYYLPCMAIVCVSQISFIIPPSSVPGRIGFLATLFLTLTNLFITHMVSNH